MIRQKNGTWKLTDEEMNLISIYAQEASDAFARRGMNGMANEAKENSNSIYSILNQAGLYK